MSLSYSIMQDYIFMINELFILDNEVITHWKGGGLPLQIFSFFGKSNYTFIVEIINPSTLRVPLERIVCYSHTFENNLGIKLKFTKKWKESFCMASDQHFYFKYFPENTFISKIFSNCQACFGCSECKWVKLSYGMLFWKYSFTFVPGCVEFWTANFWFYKTISILMPSPHYEC